MTQAATAKPTKAGWKKARGHDVTLPSGYSVKMQIPNLPLLIKLGQLPNELVTQALKAVQSQQLSVELLTEQADFYTKLVQLAVIEPKLDESDIIGDDPVPFEDIEMIVEIATRQRDLDAEGKHIGGLHTSATWRSFRGLEHLDAPVESA